MDSSRLGEILQNKGGHLGCDKHKEAPISHGNVPDGLTLNPGAYEAAQNVPVGQTISCVEAARHTYQGRILRGKKIFLQIVRKIDEAFPLRLRVSPEEHKLCLLSKQILCHFLLPGREKAGGGGNVSAHTVLNLVPDFRQQQPVLRVLGDFFNVASVHFAPAHEKCSDSPIIP